VPHGVSKAAGGKPVDVAKCGSRMPGGMLSQAKIDAPSVKCSLTSLTMSEGH